MTQLIETLDVARLLGLSSERVRELANTGRLPVANVTPSGRRLFSRSEVERFRAERQGRRQAGRPAPGAVFRERRTGRAT